MNEHKSKLIEAANGENCATGRFTMLTLRQIKEDEMGGAHSTDGGRYEMYKAFAGELKRPMFTTSPKSPKLSFSFRFPF
jgi:hypothetical protein